MSIMSKMLQGVKAVITGGAGGIGLAIAKTFAENGADVAIIDYNSEPAGLLDEIKKADTRAFYFRCDVTDFQKVGEISKEIAEVLGGIDVVVNNAGITRDNLLLRMSESDYDDVLNVNLKGSFNITKHMCRYLLKSPRGRIINIASVSGINGNVGQTNYSASKAGLIGMTKTLARELAGKKITVNAIAPGYIETAMTAALPQAVAEDMLGKIPLKRYGKPEDVANLALFLASESASYITGEVIKADGGMCI